MNKLYIILVALFAVTWTMGQGPVTTLSKDTFSKGMQTTFNLQYGIFNSKENGMGLIEYNGLKRPDIHSNDKIGKGNSLQSPGNGEFIQKYDSIQYWYWTTLINVWYPDQKQTNMTYDANNNLAAYVLQNFNGLVWENYRFFLYSYDANNNRISELTQEWGIQGWWNYWLTSYTYDAMNNPTSVLSQLWNGTTWVYSSRETSAIPDVGRLQLG